MMIVIIILIEKNRRSKNTTKQKTLGWTTQRNIALTMNGTETIMIAEWQVKYIARESFSLQECDRNDHIVTADWQLK